MGLEQTPRKWQAFDAESIRAVMRYEHGKLKCTVTSYREQCFRKWVPSGRWALRNALGKYVLERRAVAKVDFTDL